MSADQRGSMSETRNDRFRRLAEARGDRLIREISLLGNLANRKNYEYTPDEVRQLFEPIERELSKVRAQVEIATRGSQGHDRMLAARDFANRGAVTVLRISDYGTTGLRGSESVNDSRSPLSALTRGAGISANDGARGGSFGIGSAVGPM